MAEGIETHSSTASSDQLFLRESVNDKTQAIVKTSGSGSKKWTPRVPWTQAEEEALTDAYMEISNDPTVGTNQSNTAIWKRVEEAFNPINPENRFRDREVLKSHWHMMTRSLNPFSDIHNRLQRSGLTPSTLMAESIKTFREEQGKNFNYLHVFYKIISQPKWAPVETIRRSTKKTRTNLSGDCTLSGIPIDLEADTPTTIDVLEYSPMSREPQPLTIVKPKEPDDLEANTPTSIDVPECSPMSRDPQPIGTEATKGKEPGDLEANTPTSIDAPELSPMSREPLSFGIETTKRKGKAKVGESSRDSSATNETTTAVKLMVEALNRNTVATEKSNCTRDRELDIREQELIEREYQILFRSTDGMTPEELASHLKYCEQIRKKRDW